jgi:DNA polymerase III sliding clamp (beta) subunit (PCNA family)
MKMEITPPTGPGEPGAVMLTGYSAERGMLEGSLDATVEGEALTVSFNSKYMLELPFEDERFVLESNGPTSAIVLRPEASDNEVYVMMPMGMNR